MKIGICTFSFTGACREAGITPDPLDAFQLIDIATENGMDGVEFPLGNLGEHPGEKLDECRSLLSERGLAVAIDSPALMGDEMETALSQASDVGAQSMRSVIVKRPPRRQRSSKQNSRSNIAHHYDLSNDLFRLFLDETLSYSAALWDTSVSTVRTSVRATRRNSSICSVDDV